MAKDSTKAEKLSQRNLDSFMKVYPENEDLKKKYNEAVAELCELQLEYNDLEDENAKMKDAYNEIFETYIPVENWDEANSKLLLLLDDHEQIGRDLLKGEYPKS